MNGYQPKKIGDGTPPSPPTSGSNIYSPKVKRIVYSLCPVCGVYVNPFSLYCHKCGQAFRIEWDILKG